MEQKIKRAVFILTDANILIECPFCGRTVIKTNYERIVKLYNDVGSPRGKICKCGAVALLKMDDDIREKIAAKIHQKRDLEKDNGS
jgi:hypothetical protein